MTAIVVRSGSTPSVAAVSSPKTNASIRRPRTIASPTPHPTTMAAIHSSLVARTAIPPLSTSRTARSRNDRRSLAKRSRVTSALANDVSTMPASSTVSTVVRPPSRASCHTTTALTRAPMKAASGTTVAAMSVPSAIIPTAPRAAPAEVPVTYGSARGLRNSP